MDPSDACPVHGMHAKYVSPKLKERQAAALQAQADALTAEANRTLAALQEGK